MFLVSLEQVRMVRQIISIESQDILWVADVEYLWRFFEINQWKLECKHKDCRGKAEKA